MTVRGELVRFGRELVGRRGDAPDIERTYGPSWQAYVDSYFQFQTQAYGPGYTTTMTGEKVEAVIDSFLGYVQGAYKTNGVVFAVSMARAMLFTDITFRWRRYGQVGGGSDLFGNQDLLLLENPWPGGTTQSLLMRAEQDVTAAGTFFVVHEGDRLRRLRPDWCEFILTAPPELAVSSDVVGVKHTTGGVRSGGQETFYPVNPPSELENKEGYAAFWAPIPDPDAAYRGMSWLSPVLEEKQADAAATRHKLKFFENAATPNLAVTAPETLTPEQFKTFVRAMNESSQGIENAYKTLYLGGGAVPTVIGASMQQMDFSGTQGHGETRICAAGRVPPIIVGLSEGLSAATYSNYAQARRAFGDSWARPQWKSFAGAVAPLLNVPNNARLWFDTRDVAFLREDTKDLAEVLSTTMATINAAIANGFTPESSVAAVLAEDLSQLVHSGLLSVQLQDPNAVDPATLPTDPALGGEEDPAALADTEGATVERRRRAGDYVRDGDGQFARVPGVHFPEVPAAADPLKLVSRIKLNSGEKFVGSNRVLDGRGDVTAVLARVDTPEGPRLRIGLVFPEDSRRWAAADKGRTVELDAEGAAQLRRTIAEASAEGRQDIIDYRAGLRAHHAKGLEPDSDPEKILATGTISGARWGDIRWRLSREEGDEYSPGGSDLGPGGQWSLGIDLAEEGADLFYIESPAVAKKFDKALASLMGDEQ